MSHFTYNIFEVIMLTTLKCWYLLSKNMSMPIRPTADNILNKYFNIYYIIIHVCKSYTVAPRYFELLGTGEIGSN